MRHAARVIVVGLLVAPLLAASAARAQQAETVRISDEVVFLQVRANGVPMRLKIVNGEMGRISSPVATVGLTPRLTSGGAEIHVFEILSGPGGSEKIREVEQSHVDVMASARFDKSPVDLEVQLLDRLALPALPAGWSTERTGARVSAVEKPIDGKPQAVLGPCVRSCVTCDGVTACACEVWMSCGYGCCNSEACGPCIG